MSKTLCFCLFKYFPYGGLQSDFLAIALECQRRGFRIVVYTRSWDGTVPEGFDVRFVEVHALQNHRKAIQFSARVNEALQGEDFAVVIGFNRMPGLDVYFAADNCYAAKAATQRGFFYRLGGRYKTYASMEAAVFAPESKTMILLIAERQKKDFMSYYSTPEDRLELLPPGMNRNRARPQNAENLRAEMRRQLDVPDGEAMLIQIGSGFVTKGVDRTIRALAALSPSLKTSTRLWIVGKDRADRFVRLAKSLGVEDRVVFLGGRDDVPQLLLAADVMVHPAANEAAGIVLLEALAAGLPVVCSGACGHAVHISRSGGSVLPEPFVQMNLNERLEELLSRGDLGSLGGAALAYAESTDLYSQHERAAECIENVIGTKS